MKIKGDVEMNKVHYSTGKDDWTTPQELFDKLNQEFNFTLDPCSNGENAKCEKFYTKEDNGLLQDWGGERVFVNPPYSKKGKQDQWVEKCYTESRKPDTVVVALLPARTDTKRFHEYILNKAEIRFLPGRLKFGGAKNTAPFPSMIVIWRR